MTDGGVDLNGWSIVVYYGPRPGPLGLYLGFIMLKRELKTKPINECRCDERLKTRVEESTRLECARLVTELEHLKIEMRLIDEMFPSEMGEYVLFIMNR